MEKKAYIAFVDGAMDAVCETKQEFAAHVKWLRSQGCAVVKRTCAWYDQDTVIAKYEAAHG